MCILYPTTFYSEDTNKIDLTYYRHLAMPVAQYFKKRKRKKGEYLHSKLAIDRYLFFRANIDMIITP